jgi:hypothetical protein
MDTNTLTAVRIKDTTLKQDSIIMTTLRVYIDKKWGWIQSDQKCMTDFYKQNNCIVTFQFLFQI